MSESEEPPTKVQKVELSLGEIERDGGEGEGQEEWLSEGILTDEDQNASRIKSEADNSTCDESSQQSLNNTETQSQEVTTSDQQIEQTLDTMESSTVEIPEELGDFLVRKPEKVTSQENSKQSEDDGNDTDDLLRMLGEEDKNKKKQVLRSIKERSRTRDQAVVSSDDELGIKKTIIKKTPLSKSIVVKQATKAMAEVSTECETSEDEMMVKNMFKTSYKPTRPGGTPGADRNKGKVQIIRKEVRKPERKPQIKKVPVKTTQIKQIKKELPKVEKKVKVDKEEIIDEEEFLEDDNFDLDDDFVNKTDNDSKMSDRQRIMRPDAMDEDVPSDNDSKSEYDTMYDEFPSSASEDEFDDWFHMDIRSETAGDFLPLLGSKAYELLNEEKKRVSERVASLKQNLATLAVDGKKQNEELNKATLTLADLDAMLAAS